MGATHRAELTVNNLVIRGLKGIMAAEVCREHRDELCKICDEADDDLWVHPRDLPLPHEDCSLCAQLVSSRRWNIDQLRQAIDRYQDEIVEIERGMRHTAYHHSQHPASRVFTGSCIACEQEHCDCWTDR